MPTTINITLYSIHESLAKLAELKGRSKPYSRQGFANAARNALGREAVQGKLWWTGEELQEMASQMKGAGRPKNT